MFKNKLIINKIFLTILIAVLILSFFDTSLVLAQIISGDTSTDMESQLESFLDKSGFDENATIGGVIATVIKAFLGLLGIIFVILIILGGYNWMTAGGNEEKVTKAKDTITRSIIGLIIVVSAYAITYFVFTNLGGAG
jgi:hypothetical protein